MGPFTCAPLVKQHLYQSFDKHLEDF